MGALGIIGFFLSLVKGTLEECVAGLACGDGAPILDE